jgi:hypothetical protein
MHSRSFLNAISKEQLHVLIRKTPFRTVWMHRVFFYDPTIIIGHQYVFVLFMLDQKIHYFARTGPYHTQSEVP